MNTLLGRKGFIIQSPTGLFFREYSSDGTFSDYDIAALEVEVTIDDKDLVLYNDTIDYSDEILGRKE